MSEKELKKNRYYLPTILLGIIVAAVFLTAIFTYQVEETQQALVLTVGRPTGVAGPGLHFRWPLPVQEIIKYDIRKRKFTGSVGKLEETGTKDKRQVVVGICVFYRIADVMQFKKANGQEAVEDYLSNQMSNAKKSVVGKYDYAQIINADPGKMRLEQMRQEILGMLHDNLMETCGIDVFQVDFTSIGVPEKTADAIAGTMRQQRETLAAKERERGTAEAETIRIKADQAKQQKLTDAEAEAKKLRAEGDALAAKYYKVFAENAELASFLKKLDALRDILGNRTTLILHTGNVPFDIFNADPASMLSGGAGKAEETRKAPEKREKSSAASGSEKTKTPSK